MKTTIPLDNRACLYGEVRLSDPQVLALRALMKGPLYRDREGFRSTCLTISIKPATIFSLARRLLARETTAGCCGGAEITGGGKALLAKIDAEAA